MRFDNLPFDIREAILYEAIELPPTFYDPPEPFLFSPISSKDKDYWLVENQRTILRLVCREWKECVDTKTHRFIQAYDIEKLNLTDSNVQRAIRIRILEPWRLCGCWKKCKCKPPISSFAPGGGRWVGMRERAVWDKAIEFTIKGLSSGDAKTRKLEIIDMKYAITHDQLSRLSSRMQFLVQLHISPSISVDCLEVITKLSTLERIGISLIDPGKHYPLNICLPQLRYLSLSASDTTLGWTQFHQWKMPKLQTLRLLVRNPTSIETLWNQIGHFSHNITALETEIPPSKQRDFWEMFNKLQKLFVRKTLAEYLYHPPSSHPLSIISFPSFSWDRDTGIISLPKICTWINKFHGLQKVVFETTWEPEILEHLKSFNNFTSVMEAVTLVLDHFGKWVKRGVPVVDLNEIEFNEEIHSNFLAKVKDLTGVK